MNDNRAIGEFILLPVLYFNCLQRDDTAVSNCTYNLFPAFPEIAAECVSKGLRIKFSER